MLYKSYPVKVKAAAEQDGLGQGQFEAIVSVFGNIDSSGEVVKSGAFTKTLSEWESRGDPIPVYWSHRMDDPDYNIGHVLQAAETEQGLWVKAQIDTEAAKANQVYRLLKGRRVTQFSFAYEVEDAGFVSQDGTDVLELRQLTLYEVGPTPIGANQETELVGVKATAESLVHSVHGGRMLPRKQLSELKSLHSAIGQVLDACTDDSGRFKSAIPASSGPSGTTDQDWDGPANRARLSNDAGEDTYRRAFAWVDPDRDPDAKTSYKFIHHQISANGEVGAANIRACTTGIAILNGARGGTTIPDGDRQAVYNHLAKHLRDADQEPPELQSAGASGSSSSAGADSKTDHGTSEPGPAPACPSPVELARLHEIELISSS